MRKETVTELVLEYESCRVRYEVKGCSVWE